MGILLLVEIRFTFVVELPLFSCVMSASCPLASSSTWMRVIKVSKDVSFCQVGGSKRLSHFDFWYLHHSPPLAQVSSQISETIYVSPLTTAIKKNKIASLLFNVGLNIFTNFSSSIFTLISLHLCCNIYSF